MEYLLFLPEVFSVHWPDSGVSLGCRLTPDPRQTTPRVGVGRVVRRKGQTEGPGSSTSRAGDYLHIQTQKKVCVTSEVDGERGLGETRH